VRSSIPKFKESPIKTMLGTKLDDFQIPADRDLKIMPKINKFLDYAI
jgi:hypothetical protein